VEPGLPPMSAEDEMQRRGRTLGAMLVIGGAYMLVRSTELFTTVLAERGLGNQVPETIELARSARRLGAIAASAFGAGFGGSVWALVPATDAARFADEWAAVYRRQFQDAAERAAFLVTRPGPAALRVDGGQ